MDKKFEDKEGDVYEPLLKQEKKQIYTIDEIDDEDDEIDIRSQLAFRRWAAPASL